MIRLAMLFLVLMLVAALFGFGLIATAFVEIAQILFVVLLVLFLVSVIAGMMGGRRTVV